MKKTLAVLFVIVLALSAASAASRGPIVAGGNIDISYSEINPESSTGDKIQIVEMKLDGFGQYWFTEEFGTYVSVGITSPNMVESGDTSMVDYAQSAFDFTVGGTYRYEAKNGFDVVAGLGVGSRSLKLETPVSEAKFSWTVLEASATFSSAISKKNAVDFIYGLKAELELGKVKVDQKSSGASTSTKAEANGFGIVPFFGIIKTF